VFRCQAATAKRPACWRKQATTTKHRRCTIADTLLCAQTAPPPARIERCGTRSLRPDGQVVLLTPLAAPQPLANETVSDLPPPTEPPAPPRPNEFAALAQSQRRAKKNFPVSNVEKLMYPTRANKSADLSVARAALASGKGLVRIIANHQRSPKREPQISTRRPSGG